MTERFESGDVPATQRLRRLADFTSDTFASVKASTDEAAAMEAHIGRVRIGRIGMAWMNIRGPIRFDIDGGAIGHWSAEGHDTLLLSVQEAGCCEGRYSTGTFTARPGDMVLIDPAQLPKWQASCSDEMRSIAFKLPAERLLSKVPGADVLCGRRLGAELPRVALASSLLISIKRAIEAEAVEEWDDDYEDVLIGVIASALKECKTSVEGGDEQLLLRRVRVAVEQRLGDPSLDTTALADMLGIAVRTLQRLFADAGITPRGYILKRRIAAAADRLRRDKAASIIDVAMAFGFNDPSHFARVFRQSMGVSPTIYQQRSSGGMIDKPRRRAQQHRQLDKD